jgi:predicted lipoprotein with Yx(FWY)xxD motif
MIKRTRILFVGVLLAAVSFAAVATAGARSSVAHSAGTATVNLAKTARGYILVSSTGFTLYEFTKDSNGKDSCIEISGCPHFWPALQVTGTPTAGPGVKASLLSTITLPDDTSQVTYAGHPLYTYSGDSGPGETGYVGVRAFGGYWYGLRRSGRTVW